MTDIPDILEGMIHQDNTPAEPHTVNFSAQDVLAALGFEAQRLAAAVGQHAAGAPFPDPRVIQQVLNRMNHLNVTLIKFGSLLTQPTNMGGQGGMNATLDS
jgi:hypothetical protein